MKTALSAMPISLDAKIPATNVAETACITMKRDRKATNRDAMAIDGITCEIDRHPFEIDQDAIECDRVAFECG